MAGEFRRDPLTGEWVNIAGHRQNRPNLPTSGCPFCVGGLEAPEPYDTRWFVNRWPPYGPGAPVDLAVLEGSGATRFDAVGAAEVILYSPVHDGSLGSLGAGQIRKVVDLWAERTVELLARPEIDYVLVFESRGAEVGATIHHPHGQLYAFPFVPPAPAAEARHSSVNGCGVCAELVAEVGPGAPLAPGGQVAGGNAQPTSDRVVFEDARWVAWVPYASPYPFGIRLAPRRHVGGLADLDDAGRDSLAAAMCDVLGRYDRLWAGDPRRSDIFPYLMWIHQAPADHDGDYHLHVHLAPPQRSPGVPRFVAAGELGSGTMSNPVVPEEAAELLRGC